VTMPKVRLIACTRGAGEFSDRSAEEIITYAARVSSDKDDVERLETAERLLKYCLKNGHVSIFETAYMTVEVTTSRAIAEQLIRHRSFTFQVKSQRYSECHSNECYEARRQDLKNRQNSIGDLPDDTKEWFAKAQNDVNDKCQSIYDEAISKGIARESARFLLPLSTTTKLYMTGNCRSFIHYIATRTGNGTQKEHEEIAIEILEIFKGQFPIVSRAALLDV
jgi:thymidylate synthase (FAD)